MGHGLSVHEKKREIDFQDDGGHPGIPIGMILAIFDLQVAPILPTKFRVNWPFGSGEEAQNRFSRWRPSWISERNDLSHFDLQVIQMLPTKFRVNWSWESRLLKQIVGVARRTTHDGH